MLTNFILIAISLSVDALGIGIAYKVKEVRISALSKLIVCCLSVIMMAFAINIGNLLSALLPENMAEVIGVAILMIMGIKIIIQNLKNSEKKPENIKIKEIQGEDILINWAIKSFGITIKVMKNPAECDLDSSNKIDSLEAVFLGIALSVDSLSAGIAVATFGGKIFLLPIFVGIFQLVFLSFGEIIGSRIKKLKNIDNRIWSILSGIILILIAIVRLF